MTCTNNTTAIVEYDVHKKHEVKTIQNSHFEYISRLIKRGQIGVIKVDDGLQNL